MASHIERRKFLATLGGAAAAWSLTARAQQRERMRRIGVLMSYAADDPAGQARLLAFAQELAQSGWIDGRNVRIDVRWGGAVDPERIRSYAAELVALAPDVIVASGSAVVGSLLQATRAVPIVFAQVAEPVGAGFVQSLPRPGGNATGFMLYEYGIGSKWLELLKEIAPGVKQVAFLQALVALSGPGLFGAMQGSASSLGVEVRPIRVGDADEFERAIAAFAHSSNGGLIVGAGTNGLGALRHGIVKLAARHRLPAIYSDLVFATEGGLLAYAPDRVDQYRRAAGYVDRILKGEKPADLPVQAPTKYELVINLKTARALDLEVPPTLLSRADEVIE
jgi:putative tryptophan/tyrosine transport system substrate-binding protein